MKAPHGAARAHKAGHHGHAHAGASHHEGYGGRPPMHPHHAHPAHHKRDKGGGVGIIDPDKPPHEEEYTKESNVMKEAERKARGGKVHKNKMPHMLHMEGKRSRHRMDRPGRKSGGSVGADTHPMTSAHNLSSPPGEKGSYKLDKEDD